MAIQFWDLPVQWREAFSVVVSFKTEIISSQSGKEQRRAMRPNPRRAFSFKLDALPKNVDKLYFALATAQRNTVVMPEPVRYQRLAEAMSPGQGSIRVDAVPYWAKVGRYLSLLENGVAEVYEIVSIQDDRIGLGRATDKTWNKGARVSPAWKGLLSDSMSFQLPTSRVAQGSVDFDILPGQEATEPSYVSIIDSLYDREFFSFATNWADAPELSANQTRDIVDYGRGAVAMFTPVAYSARVYSVDVLGYVADDAYRLTQFFERMKGRQGEFFFTPPGAASLPLSIPVPQDQTQFLIDNTFTGSTFQSDPAFRFIEISLKTGFSYFRRVLSATLEGGRTRVMLDIGVPEIISEDNVDSISWVTLGRFESDDLTIDWQTTKVSTSRVAIRLLEYIEPEVTFGLDEGAEWLLRYFGGRFVEDVLFVPTDIVLNVKDPRFALVVDGGTQFLIDGYGRDPSDRWLLDGTIAVLNTQEPKFAEVK